MSPPAFRAIAALGLAALASGFASGLASGCASPGMLEPGGAAPLVPSKDSPKTMGAVPGAPSAGAPRLAREPGPGGDHSVVIASHLYSLYDPGRLPSREPALVWPGALEAFGAELERIDPRQVFLLGDNTRNARDEEWELLERVFAPLRDRIQFGLGNHDQNHLEAFERHGGVRQGVKLVGRNKYIQLDCVQRFDAGMLEFLERELRDADEYDHVFLLMHYFLAGWGQVGDGELGVPGERETNWVRDVVPLIADKVDVVFVGDYRPDQVRSTRLQHGEHSVQYVLNSFGFGYDEGAATGTDGPLVFLELRFEGEGFEILPRSVPLDLRHGSYGFDPRAQLRPLMLDWAQLDYGDPEAGVALKLAYPWKVTQRGKLTPGGSAELDAWVPDPISKQRLEFQVRSIALEESDEASRARAIETWLGTLAQGDAAWKLARQESLPIDGQPGLWAVLKGQRGEVSAERWSLLALHRGRAWTFTLSVPARMQGEYLRLWNHLITSVELTP